MYKETIKDNHKQGESNFLKKSRKERHMEIKQVLKDSIELKLLLKKQLKALRDKKLLDINLINSNLRLTNLDDDAII